MSLSVLKSKYENGQARKELRHRGIDAMTSAPARFFNRLMFKKGISIGDFSKSWDVLRCVQFIETHLSLSDPILDIGAYSSEILLCLKRLNFGNLTGIDLNQEIVYMPCSDKINYKIGNFLHTPFQSGLFSAITAISVIEHGFEGRKLLSEISRIISRGGYFIITVDYWPESIPTDGIKAFGMSWQIFSRKDIIDFIREAEKFSLVPAGILDFAAGEKTITWKGKRYTSAQLILKKM